MLQSVTAQSAARTCAVALRHSLDLRPVHLDRWLALGTLAQVFRRLGAKLLVPPLVYSTVVDCSPPR